MTDKIIVLGEFVETCDPTEGTGLVSSGYSAPSYWKVMSPTDPATNIVIPAYATEPNDCGDSRSYTTSEMTFTFRDHDKF